MGYHDIAREEMALDAAREINREKARREFPRFAEAFNREGKELAKVLNHYKIMPEDHGFWLITIGTGYHESYRGFLSSAGEWHLPAPGENEWRPKKLIKSSLKLDPYALIHCPPFNKKNPYFSLRSNYSLPLSIGQFSQWHTGFQSQLEGEFRSMLQRQAQRKNL